MLPTLAVADRGGARYEHGQRREQERRAEDGPDPDLTSGPSPLPRKNGGQDGDYRDHGLRQRRPYGRQYAPDAP